MVLPHEALLGLTVFLLAGHCVANSNSSDAVSEILALLNNSSLYNREIRPDDGALPVDTKIQMYIRELDVDDVNMQILVDMTFRMLWNDPRLSYYYTGVPYVTILNPKKAWLPDPFFKASLSTKQHVTVYPESYLRVSPKGDMIYSTRFSIKLYCPMDLSRFPHDRQTCPIKVASYGYTKDKVNFIFDDHDPVRFNKGGTGTQRFSLVSHKTSTCDSSTATGSYSCLQVDLLLDRIFSTYLLEWFIPTVFMVVVAWCSLLVPVHLLLPRLLLALAPMLTLALASQSYSAQLASVPYTRAIDTFMGVSLAVIFAMLIYVIVSFKIHSDKTAAEASAGSSSSTVAPEDEEAKVSKTEEGGMGDPPKDADSGGDSKFKSFLKRKGDFIIRVSLVAVYIFFLFVYLAAFSS
ncbi:glutamate-gated chloride channel-like isoform X2 [Oratosquilla oratoria]